MSDVDKTIDEMIDDVQRQQDNSFKLLGISIQGLSAILEISSSSSAIYSIATDTLMTLKSEMERMKDETNEIQT